MCVEVDIKYFLFFFFWLFRSVGTSLTQYFFCNSSTAYTQKRRILFISHAYFPLEELLCTHRYAPVKLPHKTAYARNKVIIFADMYTLSISIKLLQHSRVCIFFFFHFHMHNSPQSQNRRKQKNNFKMVRISNNRRKSKRKTNLISLSLALMTVMMLFLRYFWF